MRYFILLLLLLPTVHALDIPSPQGFVNDHAGVLSRTEDSDLEQQLRQIEQAGTVEIAILILPSLEGESLEMTSTDTFREWGIGKEDVNNGVLILVVQDSREIRIEVGYGLEGVLTDAQAGLIIRNRIAPAFRQELYAVGLSDAAQDIAALAAQDPATVSAYEKAESGGGEWIAVFVLMAVYGITYFFLRKKTKAKKTLSTITLVVAWIMSIFISSAVLWLMLFFIIMINVTSSGSAGFFFFPGGGGRRGGGFGGGGFGGFGGGMSGGGGASGGW